MAPPWPWVPVAPVAPWWPVVPVPVPVVLPCVWLCNKNAHKDAHMWQAMRAEVWCSFKTFDAHPAVGYRRDVQSAPHARAAHRQSTALFCMGMTYCVPTHDIERIECAVHRLRSGTETHTWACEWVDTGRRKGAAPQSCPCASCP